MATNEDQAEPKRVRAAQYVRMSTEQQRNFEIVRTYADEGKSGLSIEGRKSIQELIDDVENGRADYKAILVYDVSRWGRFQDADESAYYEYLCKRAGIAVHYCAEQFENDGGPTSTIIKSVKRAMAGEYSRELSSKVFKGQCRLIELGYRQGGSAGFGLRRMLVDQAGEPKTQLKRGERKSLQTDRVILVPGPDDELDVVRSIYKMFVQDGKREREVADELNSNGVLTDLRRAWTLGTVRQVLTNEKYVGNNVYNRTSFKLKKAHVHNPPEIWVRKDGAFDAIVSQELFFTAQGIIRERNRCYTNEEMIARLKILMDQNTMLSAGIIDAAEGTPTSSTYRARLGSLITAYRLAGFEPDRNYEYVEVNRNLKKMHPRIVEDIVRRLDSVGASVERDSDTDLLLINGEYSASMVLSRCRQTKTGSLRWLIKIDERFAPDITILVRMDAENENATDYYLLPIMDIETPRLLFCETNGAYLDSYQFDNLDYLASLSARKTIEVAA